MLPDFGAAKTSATPFPHIRIPDILAREPAAETLYWLKTKAPWALRVESFYEQHEFSLLGTPLDGVMEMLACEGLVKEIGDRLRDGFAVREELVPVDVAAHRLTAGQAIRIHHDHLEAEPETHRLLIQLNDGWTVERGGLLMLFSEERPESLTHVVMPTHASGFAFEISPRSFHAVSSIRSGERYTLVYTFRRAR